VNLARTDVRRERSGFMRAWKSLVNLDIAVPVSDRLLKDIGGTFFEVTFAYVLSQE